MQRYHLIKTGKDSCLSNEERRLCQISCMTCLLIEHPRRNLGNRYRAQANRFVKLAKKDPERSLANYDWAEQNARQAILHDFTDEENWRCLAKIKHLLGDGEGLEQTLRDLLPS